MLEAMAAGLPVIASDLPAHRDIVQHRATGWIAGTPDELREGLAWLDDSANNLHAAQDARRWVRETIGTWSDCAGRYAAAYQTLLEGRS
jgi:glycosyltransferase involved in cell wall biosynthesis